MSRNRQRYQQTTQASVTDETEVVAETQEVVTEPETTHVLQDDAVESIDEVVEEVSVESPTEEATEEAFDYGHVEVVQVESTEETTDVDPLVESQSLIEEHNQASADDIPTSPIETEVIEVQDQIVEVQDLPSAHDLAKDTSHLGSTDFEALRKEVSLSGANVLSMIEKYLEDMHPSKVQTEDSIAKHQLTLFRIFDIVINRLDDEDFTVLWFTLSNLFNDLKDSTLNDTTVHRGVDTLAARWNPSQFNFFFRILTILLATRNPSTRYQATQSIDWDFITQYNFTDTARIRLTDFYNH